ncbi:ATP-binding cassette domain-containing protein [Desulfobaculum sp.]
MGLSVCCIWTKGGPPLPLATPFPSLTGHLARHPARAAELLAASLLMNLLALVDTVFVMIVLRRYVAHGLDGTLYLLAGGTLVAVLVLWGVRRARNQLAAAMDMGRAEAVEARTMEHLVTARVSGLEAESVSGRGLMSDIAAVRAALGPQNLCATLDAPFVVLFIVAVWMLHPMMAVVVAVGCAVACGGGMWTARRGVALAPRLERAADRAQRVVANMTDAGETVRAFCGGALVRGAWTAAHQRLAQLRRAAAHVGGTGTALTQGASALLRVGVFGIGATYVVRGGLSVAALIGVSMLGALALRGVSQSVQAWQSIMRGRQAWQRLEEFWSLPREEEQGEPPAQWSGALRLEDVSFAWPGRSALFSGLSCRVGSGDIVLVTGPNGAGKTTLLRLVAGLVAPQGGAVRVEGARLAQVPASWWRQQICVMPQEAVFLDGTIAENMTLGPPGEYAVEMQAALGAAGMRRFIDTSEHGVSEVLTGGGAKLSRGIRRRLALARALASGGRVALFDEPTQSMDAEGRACVYAALNAMAREGRTILVASDDPHIRKGATCMLDLADGAFTRVRAAARSAPASGAQEVRQ